MSIVLNGTTGITAPDIDVTAQTTVADFDAGITLGGSADVLDDYETGTWTPNFGGTRTIASGTTNFTYTKVGRLVTLNFYAINATWTGSTTSNVMTGLPFTASSNTRDTGAVVTRFVNFTDDMVSFCVTTEAASTSLFFPQMRDSTTWDTLNMGEITTADYLHFTITYTAA